MPIFPQVQDSFIIPEKYVSMKVAAGCSVNSIQHFYFTEVGRLFSIFIYLGN